MDEALDEAGPGLGELTDDAIAGSWRVFQRARGHRYSIDDVATAWEAARARPDAAAVVDLGCGIGSVAIMLAYKLPSARIDAIEAQEISHALARRNLARNGLDARVRLHLGDLRDRAALAPLEGAVDLVTGTPPYFDPRKSSPSTDAQRTYARIEMRGGIEDYLRAGARLLAAGGAIVVCADAARPDRAIAGAAAAGLHLRARRDVIPRAGKAPLFTIWTAARERGETVEHAPIVARDEEGRRAPIQHALRSFFDLSIADEPASPPLRARTAR